MGSSKNNIDFLRTDNVQSLKYSLAAAQLSVAGGILALISAVDTYRLVALIAPITTIVGIWLFYLLHKKIAVDITSPLQVDKEIYQESNKPFISFATVFLFSTALVYLLFLGWELYVGSQVITYMLGGITTKKLLAAASLLSTLIVIYTLAKGYDWVVKTDVIQFCGIIIFILVAFIYHYDQYDISLNDKVVFSPNLAPSELWSILLSVTIINLVSQLQHPVNWQIAQSLDRKDKLKRVITFSSIVLSVIWLSIILFAFFYPSDKNSWMRILVAIDSNPTVAFFMIIGILAFMMSTADSMVFGILNNLYLVKLSLQKTSAEYRTPDRNKIRIWIPLLLIISMTVSFGLIQARPNIFFSLLSISGIMTVYFGCLIYIMLGKKQLLSASKFMPFSLIATFFIISLCQTILLSGQTDLRLGLIPIVIGMGLGFLLPLKFIWGR